jgi:hypothetical protein
VCLLPRPCFGFLPSTLLRLVLAAAAPSSPSALTLACSFARASARHTRQGGCEALGDARVDIVLVSIDVELVVLTEQTAAPRIDLQPPSCLLPINALPGASDNPSSRI